eukprot:COSAG05_NODE_75_length_21588_cov_303.091438_12_plen_114_part_00
MIELDGSGRNEVQKRVSLTFKKPGPDYCCDQKDYAKYKNGMVELPWARVIWSAAFPNVVPRATIDHMDGKIISTINYMHGYKTNRCALRRHQQQRNMESGRRFEGREYLQDGF